MHLSLTNGLGCCPSKAVVLLLLIYCFVYLPLPVGILCWSFLWYSLLCVLSSAAIILLRKRELVAFLQLSFFCLVTVNVLWLFLTVPWVGLQCVIVIFPDHIHLPFEGIHFMITAILSIYEAGPTMAQVVFLALKVSVLRVIFFVSSRLVNWFGCFPVLIRYIHVS